MVATKNMVVPLSFIMVMFYPYCCFTARTIGSVIFSIHWKCKKCSFWTNLGLKSRADYKNTYSGFFFFNLWCYCAALPFTSICQRRRKSCFKALGVALTVGTSSWKALCESLKFSAWGHFLRPCLVIVVSSHFCTSYMSSLAHILKIFCFGVSWMKWVQRRIEKTGILTKNSKHAIKPLVPHSMIQGTQPLRGSLQTTCS